jgi:hypothetical protein
MRPDNLHLPNSVFVVAEWAALRLTKRTFGKCEVRRGAMSRKLGALAALRHARAAPRLRVLLLPASMDQYPIIKRIVEQGDTIAAVIAALPFVGSLAFFLLLPVHWLVPVSGAVASAVLLLLLKSYVELVRVIADMLLPK